MVELQDLDYLIYVPIFFEGLCETVDPYRFLAIHGCCDLIDANPERIIPLIPQVILPLKGKRR